MRNPTHGREALALCARIVVERMPPAKRLIAFQDLAIRYPGVGWEYAVRETAPLVDLAAIREQQAREDAADAAAADARLILPADEQAARKARVVAQAEMLWREP